MGRSPRLSREAGVCYFHDLINDYYTIEHPLTQRLEQEKRQAPSSKEDGDHGGGCCRQQPDILFFC